MKSLLFTLTTILCLSSCYQTPEPVFVSKEQYDLYLKETFAQKQMRYLPKEFKFVKCLSPVDGDSFVVVELEGKKYLYRKHLDGSFSTEVMCPYQE